VFVTAAAEEVLTRARRAKNASKFERLWAGSSDGYSSASEADAALVAILAFYTRDEEQLARLFRSSGLYRCAKAEKSPGYIERTVRSALEIVTEQYTVPNPNSPAHGSSRAIQH